MNKDLEKIEKKERIKKQKRWPDLRRRSTTQKPKPKK